MTMTIEEIVEEMNREIASAPISEPGPGERVENCGYSRTGWAIVRANGQCTCKPTFPPEFPDQES